MGDCECTPLVNAARSYADYLRSLSVHCVLASHQPDFFPYMGYFYKMFQCDLWVITDDVLFSKTGRHNYNDILTQTGPRRFTMPIHYHLANLNELQLAADSKTIDKMVKTLWMEYRRAEHFRDCFPVIEGLLGYATEAEGLAQFNEVCIRTLAHGFELDRDRIFLRSSRDLQTERKRDERIVWLCKHLHADTYYSGTGAKDYHIENMYTEHGIDLVYSDYQPIQYPQVSGSAINMSVIDYVLNCGFNIPRGWKRYGRDQ